MKKRVTTMRFVFCNDFVCKEHSNTEVKCDTRANPAADDEQASTGELVEVYFQIFLIS
jgi:hypothetical protein